jgi:hypothetical protein
VRWLLCLKRCSCASSIILEILYGDMCIRVCVCVWRAFQYLRPLEYAMLGLLGVLWIYQLALRRCQGVLETCYTVQERPRYIASTRHINMYMCTCIYVYVS